MTVGASLITRNPPWQRLLLISPITGHAGEVPD